MKSFVHFLWAFAACLLVSHLLPLRLAARQAEHLDRGVVAVRANTSTAKVLVSWRLLETDPLGLAFNVYRTTGGGAPRKLNNVPVVNSTNFLDEAVSFQTSHVYTVRAVIDGVESADLGSFTLPANPEKCFFRIPVDHIEGTSSVTYNLSDCATGDLDGDGAYEIVVKWDPSNAQDNANDGVTDVVYLDAYKLDGTKLWRINLGPNIRAGAHYTQLVVFDFDEDGKAELAVRTSELTTFGDGMQIGDTDGDGVPNYVNTSSGRIMSGPEFLSIIEGTTGRELARTPFIPRGPESEWKKEWGDNYGNRMDRFLAGAGYFDGQHPSLLISRGYYSKTVIEAWDYRAGSLTRRWNFTADSKQHADCRGQGNHNLAVGDVDGDGCDEVVFGSLGIDHDGSLMYNTGLGHGDAMHISDMDPRRPGLEVWQVHESKTAEYGSEMHDAATGKILYGLYAGSDVGRGMAADIDPQNVGYELWSSRTGGVRSLTGDLVSSKTPSVNFGVFWSGSLNRDLLDGTTVTRGLQGTTVLKASDFSTATACNGTKNTPNLSADILGDWREEIIWHAADNKSLLVFVSPEKTSYRFVTLMQDPLYRNMIVTENVAYNQPPHPGFYLGSDLGRLIENRHVTVTADSYTADAGYDYDSVVWSNGATGRRALLRAAEFNCETKFTADIWMRGAHFRDSLYVTFVSEQPQIVVQPLASDTIVCAGQPVRLQVQARPGVSGTLTYQWYADGQSVAGSNQAVFTAVKAGTYTVKVTSGSQEVFSQPARVVWRAALSVQLSANGNVLTATTAAESPTYIWSDAQGVIQGASASRYRALKSGTYRVDITDGYGCSATASYALTGVTASPEDTPLPRLTCYPNPAEDVLHVQWPATSQPVIVQVMSLSGRVLCTETVQGADWVSLPLAGLSPGMYLLTLTGPEGTVTCKFTKR